MADAAVDIKVDELANDVKKDGTEGIPNAKSEETLDGGNGDSNQINKAKESEPVSKKLPGEDIAASTDESESDTKRGAGDGADTSGTEDAGQHEEKMEVDTGEAEPVNCYCGKDRELGTIELLCGFCLRFFHSSCTSCYTGKNVLPFMTNYQFFCKKCSSTGLESFSKKQASFSQMCQTALGNLQHQTGKMHHSKDKSIIPFIDKNWESLTTMPRRIKLTWHNTVMKTMVKDADIFSCKDERGGDAKFSLVEPDLTKIGPNYDSLFRASGAIYKAEMKLGAQSLETTFSSTAKNTRGTKRKAPDNLNFSGRQQKRGDVASSTRCTPHGYPLEHPFNKDGYRYVLAEPDPHAPNWQTFDESIEWAGKPIPGYLYRTWLASKVLLALHDRATQLRLSDDRLLVTGEKGYSMIRATHGVSRGNWYYEVVIKDMPEGTAARIGWSQALGNLQAPCGYDKFSYSWRSRKGTRFHQSRGKHYSHDYKAGDVLGFYISLPEPDAPTKLLPPSSKDKPLVKFKSHLYFEEKDYVSEAEKNLKPLVGSKITMYKNGHCQGVAWTDIYEGTYYPAISLYKNATVKVNFGPRFRNSPKQLKNYRPIAECAFEANIEHAVADMLYHVEHEGQMPEF